MNKKNILICTLLVIVALVAVILITDTTGHGLINHDVTILSNDATHKQDKFDSDSPWSRDELKRGDATWNGDVNIQLKKGGVSVNAGHRDNPMTAVATGTQLLPDNHTQHRMSVGGSTMGGSAPVLSHASHPAAPAPTTGTVGISTSGGMITFNAPSQFDKDKKHAIKAEEDIVETGDISSAPNTHPENPWGKPPIGDALLPLMLFAALWIYIKRRH